MINMINDDIIIKNIFSNIIYKLAFIAFISHGFLDFWPLLKTYNWRKALPLYMIVSISGIYVYTIVPSFVLIMFFIFSAYHFGSDWDHLSNAMFLGSTLIGIATMRSSLLIGYMGVPNSVIFGITYAICGGLSLIPSFHNKMVWVMIPLGIFGIYGVMIYAVCIHTPRSVYLLANKYGNSIYIGWIIMTFMLYSLINGLEYMVLKMDIDEISSNISSNIYIGLCFGILFAHMICTAYWRENINIENN
jgi:hypothetical protein